MAGDGQRKGGGIVSVNIIFASEILEVIANYWIHARRIRITNITA